MEKLCWTQCLPLKDQCSMPSSVHNEHGFLAFVVFLPAFSATGTDIQSDIDANQTFDSSGPAGSTPSSGEQFAISVANVLADEDQLGSTPYHLRSRVERFATACTC
jgi:hypothetical protein